MRNHRIAVPIDRHAPSDAPDDSGVTGTGRGAAAPCFRNRHPPGSASHPAVNDRGSVLPLVAGLLAVCGVFVVGVVDATDLAIARADLHTVADGAALAAAQSVTPTNARVTGGRLVITLTAASIKRDAQRYITDSRTSGVRLRSASTPDGHTAVVTVTRTWRAPLDIDFFPIRIALTATARARTVFDE